MKNTKYLGLLAIPLAALGIVGSVAFAQSTAVQTTTTPAPSVQQATSEVADENEAPDQAGTTASETQVNRGDDATEATDASDDAETSDGPDGGPTDGGK